MLPSKIFFKNYTKENSIPWQEKNILAEYLQTQILLVLSSSSFNTRLSFLGGTCLRFIHKANRFSEDLDFDLAEKRKFNIYKLAEEIKNGLEDRGFNLDTKVKKTEVIYIVSFRFKGVLQEFNFDVPKNQKLLVKFEIDFNPAKSIQTETGFVESFNEKFPLKVNTLETLYSQKIIAITSRPYQKGRDFYDLVWFLAQKKLEPNYKLLKEKKFKIKNRGELVDFLEDQVQKSDLKQAAKDVERFLFYPQQAQWILNLPEYLEGFRKGHDLMKI